MKEKNISSAWMYSILIIGLVVALNACKSPTGTEPEQEEQEQKLELTTSAISNITTMSASGGGSITSAGSAAIQERGVCWNTDPLPTIDHNKGVASGSQTDFEVDITGLSPETTYYVRAYATTSEGTTYGNEESFTTLAETSSGNNDQGKIYWIEEMEGNDYRIRSSDLDGGNRAEPYEHDSPGSYTAYDVFYLPSAQEIFFLEFAGETTERIRTRYETRVTSSANTDIEYMHVSDSLIFWIEYQETGEEASADVFAIRSSTLTGVDKKTLYKTSTSAAVELGDITYNELADRIYFTKTYGEYGIFSIKSDGSGYRSIASHEVTYLATSNERLYWVDSEYYGSDLKSVIKSSDLNGNNIATVFVPINDVTKFDIGELTIDGVNKKIYFIYEVERNDGTVSSRFASVNFNGGGFATLYSHPIPGLYINSITVSTIQPGY